MPSTITLQEIKPTTIIYRCDLTFPDWDEWEVEDSKLILADSPVDAAKQFAMHQDLAIRLAEEGHTIFQVYVTYKNAEGEGEFATVNLQIMETRDVVKPIPIKPIP